jgi:hypothetical protein
MCVRRPLSPPIAATMRMFRESHLCPKGDIEPPPIRLTGELYAAMLACWAGQPCTLTRDSAAVSCSVNLREFGTRVVCGNHHVSTG